MTVDIIQFKLPTGASEHITWEVSDDCEVGYEALKKHGCRLTMEILRTGEVSSTIEHPEGDFDGDVTPNGPEVKVALEKMIRRFDAKEFADWIIEMKE